LTWLWEGQIPWIMSNPHMDDAICLKFVVF
jgi:hypothetical protein